VRREPRGRRPSYTVDVVALTPRDGELALLLQREGRERWRVPCEPPQAGETLSQTAARISLQATGVQAAWITQVGAFADEPRRADDADLSVAYVALVPAGAATAPDLPEGSAWHGAGALPQLAERQRGIVDAAIATVRDRLDLSPVAFRLLPLQFTLSELQQMYELLLGRRLHKASFRRALQGASLVEPTDQWRSEGRGRPAQLYRYAPKKRRRARRGVRFDLLGG